MEPFSLRHKWKFQWNFSLKNIYDSISDFFQNSVFIEINVSEQDRIIILAFLLKLLYKIGKVMNDYGTGCFFLFLIDICRSYCPVLVEFPLGSCLCPFLSIGFGANHNSRNIHVIQIKTNFTFCLPRSDVTIWLNLV